MSELWQLGALQLADKLASGNVTSCAVAEQIHNIVGSAEPIDPVTA